MSVVMAKRGRHRAREELVGPTPETRAKLRLEPVRAWLEARLITQDAYDAAIEIREVFFALTRVVMVRARDYSDQRSVRGTPAIYLSTSMLKAYVERYKPWADSLAPGVLSQVIDCVVDGWDGQGHVVRPALGLYVDLTRRRKRA